MWINTKIRNLLKLFVNFLPVNFISDCIHEFYSLTLDPSNEGLFQDNFSNTWLFLNKIIEAAYEKL